MKAKVVTFGELVFRNEKALAKFLAAAAEADTLPTYSGDSPSLSVRDIDEKEIEYRNLPTAERNRFSSWERYARGEAKDVLQQAFDDDGRLQTQHGYSFARYREARIGELIRANDRAALEAIIASHGPSYHNQMPADLQVAIDACLSGTAPTSSEKKPELAS